jgi:D-aspartate ligase
MNEFLSVPVIVIGSSTTALSCLRLSARAGAVTYAACPSDSWPSRTRWFRPVPMTSIGVWCGELGERGLDFLRALPFEQCVLIPATDDSACWLASLPDSLLNRFPVSCSSVDTMRTLQDKSHFSALVDDLNIPAPLSIPLQSEHDFDRIPFEKISSLFLKPTDSQSFVAAFKKKAIWVHNKADAIQTWKEVRDRGFDLIAQEYVSGGAADHYFIDGFRDKSGVVRAKTARRRYRIYPADFGNSSYCKSIDFSELESAWQSLRKILDEVQYRGIFSAEFKKDLHTGEFKILEINTRPWVFIEFASVCGMNMCDLYLRDALGRPVPSVDRYAVGKGCANLFDDIVSVVEMNPAERPAWSTLARQWVGTFKLLFSWRDPKPVMFFWFAKLRSWFSKSRAH